MMVFMKNTAVITKINYESRILKTRHNDNEKIEMIFVIL